MSEATQSALEAAISAHVADEYDGDMVTGWVVIAETTAIEMLDRGEGSMVVLAREMQSSYLTTGLIFEALSVDDDAD